MLTKDKIVNKVSFNLSNRIVEKKNARIRAMYNPTPSLYKSPIVKTKYIVNSLNIADSSILQLAIRKGGFNLIPGLKINHVRQHMHLQDQLARFNAITGYELENIEDILNISTDNMKVIKDKIQRFNQNEIEYKEKYDTSIDVKQRRKQELVDEELEQIKLARQEVFNHTNMNRRQQNTQNALEKALNTKRKDTDNKISVIKTLRENIQNRQDKKETERLDIIKQNQLNYEAATRLIENGGGKSYTHLELALLKRKFRDNPNVDKMTKQEVQSLSVLRRGANKASKQIVDDLLNTVVGKEREPKIKTIKIKKDN